MITVAQVKRLFEENRGFSAKAIGYIPQGENNWAFKVATVNGNFLFRVAKNEKVGLAEKLRIIEDLLENSEIPHAKLLSRGVDSEHAPFGYQIFEFINGLNGSNAILQGKISFQKFHEKLGAILKKVHANELPHFGPIPHDVARTNSDFIDHNLVSTKKVLLEFEHLETNFPKGLSSRVAEILTSIQSLNHKLTPVLCHTDPPPNNCIYTPQGEIILIDWDNALGTTWVVDFADLTYSGSHMTALGPREERRKIIWESFLATHGLGEFTETELLQAEKVCHVLKAVYSLPYYYHTQSNMEWFWKTTDRLVELVK